jgi:hypothetical protein
VPDHPAQPSKPAYCETGRPYLRRTSGLANEDPLLRAADRWRTLRRFAPDLIEALEFCAVRAGDPMLAALQLLAELNRSGKREVPADAPMPFRKEWRRLVTESGAPNRRLYEMAVLATLRDKLRSGDIWVEPSSDPLSAHGNRSIFAHER